MISDRDLILSSEDVLANLVINLLGVGDRLSDHIILLGILMTLHTHTLKYTVPQEQLYR